MPYSGVTQGTDPATDAHFWQLPWVPMDRAPQPGAAPHQGRARWGSTHVSDETAAGSAQLLALLSSVSMWGINRARPDMRGVLSRGTLMAWRRDPSVHKLFKRLGRILQTAKQWV